MVLPESLQVATAYCVAENDQRAFATVVEKVDVQLDDAWRVLLKQLDASRFIRLHNRVPSNKRSTVTTAPHITYQGEQCFWHEQQIGKKIYCYKTRLPHEMQARIAYDILYDRYVAFVAAKYKLVALQTTEHHIVFFKPITAPSLDVIWTKFVNEMFSGRNLQRTFLNLLNTIKLTEGGFSVLDVPLVTVEHAYLLAAFYLSNIESLRAGDAKREREIEQLQFELEELLDQPKEEKRIQKKIAKLEGELADRAERYDAIYSTVEELREKKPEKMADVRRVAWTHTGGNRNALFGRTAGVQLKKSGAVVGSMVREIGTLIDTEEADLFVLPNLVEGEITLADNRPAGDDSTGFCYACGSILARRTKKYKANKFIFESPSQRLQSGSSQKEPKICATCAAVSFVSPIKLGGDRLIVRLENRAETNIKRADDTVRMFQVGEMNIVAGRYVILKASEKYGKDLVVQKLGGVQYAMLKIAHTFLAQLFYEFSVFAVVSGSEVELPRRHLIWLHHLGDIFYLNQQNWKDKAHFGALNRAIRHVQRDDLIAALYELLPTGLTSLPLNGEQRAKLEQLREVHVGELTTMEQNERSQSSNSPAQLYRDVAAVSGLLYPFLAAVYKRLQGSDKQRIEVRKLIERSDEPENLIYTIAPHLTTDAGFVNQYLNRRSDTYFSYDCLLALLSDLDSQPDERKSQYENSIALTLEDIRNVYAHLQETRYSTQQAWRTFTYKLNLSLASRFPQLYQSKKED